MVAVPGIGGAPEPVKAKPSPPRQGASPETAKADRVEISPAAIKASQGTQAAQSARRGSEVRQDRVAAAKENLEQGVYRIQEVVLQVAERIGRFAE